MRKGLAHRGNSILSESEARGMEARKLSHFADGKKWLGEVVGNETRSYQTIHSPEENKAACSIA